MNYRKKHENLFVEWTVSNVRKGDFLLDGIDYTIALPDGREEPLYNSKTVRFRTETDIDYVIEMVEKTIRPEKYYRLSKARNIHEMDALIFNSFEDDMYAKVFCFNTNCPIVVIHPNWY